MGASDVVLFEVLYHERPLRHPSTKPGILPPLPRSKWRPAGPPPWGSLASSAERGGGGEVRVQGGTHMQF